MAESSHTGTTENCFFIVGSGRSGNTLLRRLLVEHYRVYVPPETYVLGPVIGRWRKRRWLGSRYAIAQTLKDFEKHPEYIRFPISRLSDIAEQILSASSKSIDLKSLLDSLYRYWGEAVAVDFEAWGDKTPLNTFYVEEIRRVFPAAKFIFIYRDAIDVVSSYVKAGIYTDLDRAAQRWVDANKAMLSFQSQYPHQVFQVKYENFVVDRESILEDLAEFLGVQQRREPMTMQELRTVLGDVGRLTHHDKVLRDVDTNSIGKGRRSLTESDLISLSGTLDPTLSLLDYDVCLPISENRYQ